MENPCRYCAKWDPADREFGQVGCLEMCRAGVEYIAEVRHGVGTNQVFMVSEETAKRMQAVAKEPCPGEVVGEFHGVKFVRVKERRDL